jgi:hypothetical protein
MISPVSILNSGDVSSSIMIDMRESFERRLQSIFNTVSAAVASVDVGGSHADLSSILDAALIRERDSALSSIASSAAHARAQYISATAATNDAIRERDLAAAELRDAVKDRNRVSAELQWERMQRVAEAQRAQQAENKASEAVRRNSPRNCCLPVFNPPFPTQPTNVSSENRCRSQYRCGNRWTPPIVRTLH